MKVTDHKGTEYRSIKAMCRAYNISDQVYRDRMKTGRWTQGAALTTPAGEVKTGRKGTPVTDHRGNTYPSIKAMCETYGIALKVFNSRKELGWSTEQVLTTPVKRGRRGTPVTDHRGNTYSSTRAMCRAYGIQSRTYGARRRAGWDLEKALTAPVEDRTWVKTADHKGNEYASVAEMCRAYGISYADYAARRKRGWDLEKALTTPVRKKDSTTEKMNEKSPGDGLTQ